MSSRDTTERRARRSSILKKANTEEPNVDLTEYTEFSCQLGNQKKFSKRVSFSNTNQVKEIAPLWDIGKNWQDSASSEEGASTLADISNLTTPRIIKPTLLDKRNKSPEALQNLLKGTIIDHNSSNNEPLVKNVDITRVVSGGSKFSFFDNSRLEFQCPADGNEDAESLNEEGMNVSLNYYTKNLLKSLNFVSSENTIDNTMKTVCPDVNPPSYNQCIGEVRQTCPTSGLKISVDCERDDLKHKPVSDIPEHSEVDACGKLLPFAKEFNEQHLEHDMDFTECITSEVKKIGLLPVQKIPSELTASATEFIVQPNESLTEQQMDFTTCVAQGDKKWVCPQESNFSQSSAIQSGNIEQINDSTGNQMDFTECKSSMGKINESIPKQNDSGAMECTEFVCGLPAQPDEMDFTNVSSRVCLGSENITDMAVHGMEKIPHKLENMDITEMVTGSHLLVNTAVYVSENAHTVYLNTGANSNMDFTCTSINPAVGNKKDSIRTAMPDKDEENQELHELHLSPTSIGSGDVSGTAPRKESGQSDVLVNAESDVSMDMTCFTATNVAMKVADIENEPDKELMPGYSKERPTQSLVSSPSVASAEDITFPSLGNMAASDGTAGEFTAEKAIDNAHRSDTENVIVSTPSPKKISKARNSIGLYKANMMRIKRPRYEDLSALGEKDENSVSETDVDSLSLCEEENDSVFQSEVLAQCPITQTDDKCELGLVEDVCDSVMVDTRTPKELCKNDAKHPLVIKPTHCTTMTGNNQASTSLHEETDFVPDVSNSKEILGVAVEFEHPVVQSMKINIVEIDQPANVADLVSINVPMDPQSQKMVEEISLEEFLNEYAGIHMTRQRLSINFSTDKPNPPSSLREMFRAKYWIPREHLIRQSFEESIEVKMSKLEEVVAKLEEDFLVSRPKIFRSLTRNHAEDPDALLGVKKLAARCKSLGNLNWKRDIAKLFKGLNEAMELYKKDDLQQITNQLKSPREMLNLALKELKSGSLDIEMQPYENKETPPTAEQIAEYEKIDTELTELNKECVCSLEKKAASLKRKQDRQTKREEMLDKILHSGEEVEIQMLEQSLALLERRSKWKLVTTNDESMEFSFLCGTVFLKVVFEDKQPSFEWSRKIRLFSVESAINVKLCLKSDIEIYKLVHKMWHYLLSPDQLLLKYPDLGSLKILLKLMSDLAQKSEDLIEDKHWINSRIVTEFCFKHHDCTFSVDFQPPRIRTDGFVAKFILNSGVLEQYEDPLEEVLKNGFLPNFHECLHGKRQWDCFGPNDIEQMIRSVAPGDHYIKRVVHAILDYIDYKF